jgi:hypothetical protein
MVDSYPAHSQVLDEVDYDNMRIGETKYLHETSTGVYETDTSSTLHASAHALGVTKNLLGPSFSIGAEAGLFKT